MICAHVSVRGLSSNAAPMTGYRVGKEPCVSVFITKITKITTQAVNSSSLCTVQYSCSIILLETSQTHVSHNTKRRLFRPSLALNPTHPPPAYSDPLHFSLHPHHHRRAKKEAKKHGVSTSPFGFPSSSTCGLRLPVAVSPRQIPERLLTGPLRFHYWHSTDLNPPPSGVV